jgi:hypothetical protein
MTVINNIEIDNIQYTRNEMKEAIINNDPIDNKLHVIVTISNPCLYARRYILMKEFINRMELEETNVVVYVVELVYKNQKYIITKPNNPRHLQIRTETPIWHKENMTNLGVRRLLPQNWKAMAWIDSDIEFENPTWAMDTLKILNGTKDVVQIFSHCVDMNQDYETMTIFTSFGQQFVKKMQYTKKPMNFWHPGYGWACTRKAFDKMGGLYDKGILGSGDNIMALCFIQQGLTAINEESTQDYKDSVLEYQDRVKQLRLGYVPGVVRHHFHGSKKNRNYGERWKILVNYNYAPSLHVTYDTEGILIPTPECPKEMLDEIFGYFQERNEDEYYTWTAPTDEKPYQPMPGHEDTKLQKHDSTPETTPFIHATSSVATNTTTNETYALEYTLEYTLEEEESYEQEDETNTNAFIRAFHESIRKFVEPSQLYDSEEEEENEAKENKVAEAREENRPDGFFKSLWKMIFRPPCNC